MVLTTLGAGRSLTILDGSPVARDAYNNDVPAWAETVVGGCSWWPSATTESGGSSADQVTSRYGVLFPDGTAVKGVDRVRLPGISGVWEIDGEPRQHVSTLTGTAGGIYAWLQKVTG